MSRLSFQQIIQQFRTTYKRFEKIEGRPWGAEGAVMEMMKQVGELAMYMMVAESYYPETSGHMKRAKELGRTSAVDAISDELIDVFSMVIRLADYYEIDLEEAHIRARQEEDNYLKSKNI